MDENFSDPHDRKTARELFFKLFRSRKEAIDWITEFSLFENEKYRETILENIRDCVDAVLKVTISP